MMQIQWSSRTATESDAPALRLYAAAVVAAPESQEDAVPQWLQETLAEEWRPVRLEWAANSRPSTLTIRRVLGQGPGRPVRGRPESRGFAAGDRIRLVVGAADGRGDREWFRGCIAQERLLIQTGGDGEVCQAVAYGPEILLRGKVVSGQWHATPAVDEAVFRGSFLPGQLVRAGTFRSHLPVIFNEAGRPNATPAVLAGKAATWRLDGRGEAAEARCRTFDGPARRIALLSGDYRAEAWTAGSAVQSLIELVDGYTLISPESLDAIPPELFERTIGQVNVEGLALLDALAAVLLPIGYGLALEPWADDAGRHALRVFALHGPIDSSRIRKPFLAPVDGEPIAVGDVEARRVEVQRIEFIRDNHNVINNVTVIGDQKRTQVALTFGGVESTLVPAWDTMEHDLAGWAVEGVIDPMQWPVEGHEANTLSRFEGLYAYAGQGAAACRHAFRGFAWNEDGAFCGVADSPGDASACASGDGMNYSRRVRPIGPTFLWDDAAAMARHLPAMVQLGIQGDEESWIQVPAVIWPDRAGFTIPVDPLWDWYPYASDYARHAGQPGDTLLDRYGHLSYLTLLHNALRSEGPALALRLIGSAECDEAVVGRAARRVGSSWPFPAAGVVRAEDRFRCRQVGESADVLGLGAARYDTRDDSAEAADYAASVRDGHEDEVGHGSITLRQLTAAYSVGDVIPGTLGRPVDLTLRGGEGAFAPVVIGVIWSFQEGSRGTELLLDSSLLRMME